MSAANTLQPQMKLADAHSSGFNLFTETFSSLHVDGTGDADRVHNSIDLEKEKLWIPDKAQEYDYCIVLPEKSLETGYYKEVCTYLMEFGLDLFTYKARVGHVMILIKARTEIIRNFADDLNYKMLLDPEAARAACKAGNPDKDIAPFDIADNKTYSYFDPYEYCYVKYSVNCDEKLYWRPKGHDHPFTDAERCRLLGVMIESRPKTGAEPIKIARRIRNGQILGFFPLHRPQELERIAKSWLSWGIFPWSQPFHAIKSYFGEKIGLYYVFMGHYTRWLIIPALMALPFQFIVFFGYPTLKEGFNSDAIPFYSVFICLWGIFMMQTWKKVETRTALEWGTSDFEANESEMPEFRGDKISSPITGEPNKLFYPNSRRSWFIRLSALIIFVLILLVVGIVASIYLIRRTLVTDGGLALSSAQTIASIINAVQIALANMGYALAAKELTRMENHRTLTAYEDALTNKIFAFQFVNSYSSFFYVAYFANQLEDGGCGAKGCMFQLGTNLAIIFGSRVVTAQVTQLLIPFLTLTSKDAMNDKEAINMGANAKPESRPESEFELNPYNTSEQVITDYSETAINFGYQCLFVSSLPATSCLALISNIVETKGDAWRMSRLHQRPVPLMAEDIGSFQMIFQAIAMSAVITNASLLKFTMTCLNSLTQYQQWWIFVAFQWALFAAQLGLMVFIEDESESIWYQKQRSAYLETKLIDQVADDTVKSKVDEVEEVHLEEYPDYGGLAAEVKNPALDAMNAITRNAI